ncbi:hypothetical protein L1987_89231 [Smallanthus sonchifolius]|nr:hypothetical protein L1987_89274 [Smallanthus sonchifolius]KAI3666274.1 hypothetical protein L1987_89231 [Smallanthus sonchifolius]
MATLFESHSNVPSAEPGIFNFDVAIGSSSGCALSPIHGSNPQVMRPESRDLLLQQVQEKTERIGLLLKLGLLLVRTSDLVALKAEEEAPNAVKSCAALLDTPVEDAPLEKAVSASAFPAPSFYPQLYSEGEGQTLLLYGNSDLTMKDLSHSSVGAVRPSLVSTHACLNYICAVTYTLQYEIDYLVGGKVSQEDRSAFLKFKCCSRLSKMAKRGFYKESPAVSLKSFRAGPYRREAARPRHPCSRPPSNTHAQMPSHLTRLVSKRLEYPAYPATRATKTTATPATSLPMTDSPEKAVDTATDSFSSTDSAGDSFSYSLPTSSSSALA